MLKEAFKDSSYFVQLTTILFLIITGLAIFLALGILLSPLILDVDFSYIMQNVGRLNVENISLLKFLQSMYSIGMFIFPSIVAAWLFGDKIARYLKINKVPKFILILLAIAILIALTPAMNFVVEWNEGISLPESLKGLEDWFKQMENDAKKMSEMFLAANSFSTYLSNVLVLALIPAIGEEFLFRGVLQKIFYKWSNKIHLSIWLSAFLFSAMHFQFYGFVPRMLLGALFGYMLFWSGNLWIPVIAHFFNNLLAVSVFYFNNDLSQNIENIGMGENNYVYIITGILLFSILLFYFYRLNTNYKKSEKQK